MFGDETMCILAKAVSVPTWPPFPLPRKVKAETAIQDLYSLALAISGLICLAFVGTGRSTAKTVENKKKKT